MTSLCFADQCYVPLVRAIDESVPASVAPPVVSQALPQVMQANNTHSPHKSPLAVKALAGPMSPMQVRIKAGVISEAGWAA